MKTYLLMITFRVWLVEIGVSGINYFLLMKRLYDWETARALTDGHASRNTSEHSCT